MTKLTIAVDNAEDERLEIRSFLRLPGAELVSRERHDEASAVVSVLRIRDTELRVIRMFEPSAKPDHWYRKLDSRCTGNGDFDDSIQFQGTKPGMPFPDGLDHWPDESEDESE